MAHAIETRNGKASMFFVDKLPWHGLGTELQDNPTIEEAITAAGLDWEVELCPVQTSDGTHVPMTRALRRNIDNTIFGTVGLQYHPLQNRDAFSWFAPFLEAGEASLHTGGALHDGKKVWFLAKINRDPVTIGNQDDIVEKFVLLSNSHDGTTSIRAGFTPIRVVCANTLALAHGDKANSKLIRVKHTKRLQDNLETIRETMNLMDQEFNATAEQYRRLRNKGVSQADIVAYVREVFKVETSSDKLNGQQQRLFASVSRLFEEGPGVKEAGKNLWGAYNAVTAYCSYERGNTQDTRLTSLWFGESQRTIHRALEVAIAMAA